MRVARLGVIGGGTFGWFHLTAYSQLQREGKAQLVALADVKEEVLERRAKEFNVKTYKDYREMLEREELNAVSVVTPDHLHREIALDALEAGLHVLVEKPMDVTVEGAEEMAEAAQRKGLLLQVDFHKRYDPYHIELRRAVLEGRIGEVEYGYSWMEDKVEVPRDWLKEWAARSSPVWFLGVHMFDLARWLMGGPKAKRVYALGWRKKLPSLGLDTYDAVKTTVEFDNGAVFTFDNAWILPDGFEAVVHQGIRIVGTEGTVEVNSQYRGARGCSSGEGMFTWNTGYRVLDIDERGREWWRGYGFESIAEFALNVNVLLNGGRLEDLKGKFATAEDGIEATKIAVAAHRSLETGKVVEL